MGMSKNFYFDNLLLCSETVEEAVSAVGIARQVMVKAGMRLREFVAANPDILRGFPPGYPLAYFVCS
uniref:DUF4242 domain-containing protein n=1 Tax=Globodera pallida TaxID=36090 RepID=A0A183CE57_GLOPA